MAIFDDERGLPGECIFAFNLIQLNSKGEKTIQHTPLEGLLLPRAAISYIEAWRRV